MPSYPVGDYAANIIAVNIDKDGKVYPYTLARNPKTGVVTVDMPLNPYTLGLGGFDFTIDVNGGPALVSFQAASWDYDYDIAHISLGQPQPFVAGEVQRLSGYVPSGTYGAATTLTLHATKDQINWNFGTISTGSMVIGDTYKEMSILLRLPTGSSGTVRFVGIAFTAKAGGGIVNLITK